MPEEAHAVPAANGISPGTRDGRPAGGRRAGGPARFVVQRHRARRALRPPLRDRAECASWAVPRGPTRIPTGSDSGGMLRTTRFEYSTSKAVDPPREYGGGGRVVWDRGTWSRQATDGRQRHRRGRVPRRPDGGQDARPVHLVRDRRSRLEPVCCSCTSMTRTRSRVGSEDYPDFRAQRATPTTRSEADRTGMGSDLPSPRRRLRCAAHRGRPPGRTGQPGPGPGRTSSPLTPSVGAPGR